MKQLLKRFGLNDKEQISFLRLLEIGAQPISVLAKQVGIPRSSMYLVLENLKNKGFVEEFERIGIKYVKCISVKEIPYILEKQEYEIKKTKKILGEKIGELEKLENKLSITPKVRFYEGISEIEKMYQKIISETQNNFRAIFNPYLVKKIVGKYFYRIGEQLKEKGKNASELLIDCSEALEYKNLFISKTHQIKILPKELKFKSDIIIINNTIFMISYDIEAKNISGVEIYNPVLAETQKIMFDQLWEKYNKEK